MLSSKVGTPESRLKHSLTSKCRFKNLTINVVEFKSRAVAFMFPLFLADLDKKYGNEIEMDEK